MEDDSYLPFPKRGILSSGADPGERHGPRGAGAAGAAQGQERLHFAIQSTLQTRPALNPLCPLSPRVLGPAFPARRDPQQLSARDKGGFPRIWAPFEVNPRGNGL